MTETATIRTGRTALALVIPDVHERVAQLPILQNLIDEARACDPTQRIIFMGDVWDTHGEHHPQDICDFISTNLPNTQVEFLLGNHDAHYLFSSGLLRSSGYSWGTAAVINGWPDKNRYTSGLKFCTNVGKWWLSHAGIHPSLDCYKDPAKQAEAFALLRVNGCPQAAAAGWSRGGTEEYGGLTWLDWSEHEVGQDDFQICGHTFAKEVRRLSGSNGEHICLDTGLRHVAVIHDDDSVEVKAFISRDKDVVI